MEELVARLQERGSALGLVGLGICHAEPFSDVRAEMESRLAGGKLGRMRFTYTDPDTATDIRRSFPWASRLVVGATTYLPAAGNPGPDHANHGRVARFATSDHYALLRRGLGAVREILVSAGFQAETLVDDNRLVDRAAAIRAGIAWWGKSTMVLTPKYGPWTLLGSVATDAELPVTKPMQRDCGTCTACVPACPTGALDRVGIIDATRCISYWAQMPGDIPIPIREAWGDRLYGCDACLDACPPGQRWSSEAADGMGRVDLVRLLTQPDHKLLADFSHFYLPRNDPAYLRRNALVALGHCGSPEATPVVAEYVESKRAMLRSHAAWALGRLGDAATVKVLTRAVKGESSASVSAEIEAALVTLRGEEDEVRPSPTAT